MGLPDFRRSRRTDRVTVNVKDLAEFQRLAAHDAYSAAAAQFHLSNRPPYTPPVEDIPTELPTPIRTRRQPEPEPELDDWEQLQAKRQNIKRASAHGRPVPESARESYLHAKYKKAIRTAHEQGFRYGLAEGEARANARPLEDVLSAREEGELVTYVMKIVLGNADLRSGYRHAADLMEQEQRRMEH